MRQVVLDTETTGINPLSGHRIIEIGCVELVDRKLTGKHYHEYINPKRVIEVEAMGVHGITNEFLVDKPIFENVAQAFYEFIKGSELVIHNAAFDVGFINNEFSLMGGLIKPVEEYCGVLDTLAMARKKHPGQKNNLNALCSRYGIDTSHRTLHGALLDAEILADVYLLLSGGQSALLLDKDEEGGVAAIRRVSSTRQALSVIKANDVELNAHDKYMANLGKNTELVPWQA